ncbi:MAG: hypothetical protein ACFFCZ_17000 [Promethearchaeota archaeon]
MSMAIDSLKKGFQIWKQAWLTEIIALLVLAIASVFVLIPVGIISVILIIPFAGQDWSNYTALEFLAANPMFVIIVLIMGLLMGVIVTIFIGGIQKVAHEYAQTGSGRFEDTIRALIPDIIPLTIVGVVMSLIIGIPLIIVNLILSPLTNTQTQTPPPSGIIDLVTLLQYANVYDILQMIIMTVIIAVFIGPWFLATSKVVIDGAGPNGIIEGWKLYAKKFIPTIIMVVIFGIIFFAILFIFGELGLLTAAFVPLDVGTPPTTIPTTLPLLLGLSFIIMVLAVVIVFAVIPWGVTAMYAFYQDIKDKE